jgi:hypothetical protein
MKMFLFAFALMAQNQDPSMPPEKPTEGPLMTGDRPERSLSPAHDLYYEDSAPPTPEALIAAHDFGTCVADRSAVVARGVLQRDFTTRAYDRELRRLTTDNRECFSRRGSMRSGSLPIAGAIAERLIERESEPVNVLLARAALRPATPGYSPTDRAAICVVRSVPDEVARLLATNPTGNEEAMVAESLKPILAACMGSRQPVEATPAGLRAILATAAFREINSNAAPVAEARN